MTDAEENRDAVDDRDDDATVVVNRRARAGKHLGPGAETTDEDATVVGRRRGVSGRATPVDAGPEEEPEVVSEAEPELEAASEIDGTVVGRRHVVRGRAEAAPEPEGDATVVGRRRAVSGRVAPVHAGPRDEAEAESEGDATVVGRRRSAVEPESHGDETVVGRRGVRDGADRRPDAEARATLPNRARRTRIVLPVGTAPSLRAADGVGAGAVEAYTPRQIPPAPAPAAPLATGLGRDERARAAALPSVLTAARRGSFRVLAATLAACAVTIAGITIVLAVALGP